jgi:trans-aconitate methyltransferase
MGRAPLLARQFGDPSGPVGRLVGRIMVRGNRAFNGWLVEALRERLDPDAVTRIVELGPGPGVGLAYLLDAFPRARLSGVDRSDAMLSQAQRRNARAVEAGKLDLVHGDASAVQQLGPVDLIVAVHVLYFWPDPVRELGRLATALAQGGALALGYQLRPHMPRVAQQQFPKAGHRLYTSDDEVRRVLADAGLSAIDIAVKGPADAPHGRLALATR